ncbi:MAG: hypothetical protein MJ087_00305 [Lachnospiraceae bacterium]|nr:hypothetical protein [Lachnospiraceae bacterium]
MIGCAYGIFGSGNFILERNLPGNGSNSWQVILKNHGERECHELELSEKTYTQEELEQAFEDGFSYIRKKLLTNNNSLQEIREDVEIVWSIPDTSLRVSWEFEDESVLDMEGVVYNDDFVDEQKVNHLKATLSYEDEEREVKKSKVYTLVICPKLRNEGQAKIYQAWKKMISIENDTKNQAQVSMPGKIGETKIAKKGTKNPFFLVTALCIFVALLWILRRLEEEKIAMEQRKKEAKLLYPDIIWQFVLLIEAGHTVPMAWKKIVEDYYKKREGMTEAKRYVYEQMATSARAMELGVSYDQVFRDFANTMRLKSYSKLMTLFSQTITKGSKNMLQILKEEENQAFFERLEEAKRLGEEADTKLLLPMGLMLLNILLLLMIPAYMQFVS